MFGVKPDSGAQAFARACRRADIQDLRFYDLRHEATSRLFEKEVESNGSGNYHRAQGFAHAATLYSLMRCISGLQEHVLRC